MGLARMGVPGEATQWAQHSEEEEEDDDNVEMEMERRPMTWEEQARRLSAAQNDDNDDDVHSDDTDLEEEMMRIDAVSSAWRQQLQSSDPVDAQNAFGNWCPAMVLQIADGEAHIRYLNMLHAWQRWVPIDSGQLAEPMTRTRNDGAALRLAQPLEVNRTGWRQWKAARVVETLPDRILVRYEGWSQQFDEWIPFHPDAVAPSGEHLSVRQFAKQRRLSVTPSIERRRMIQAQNPRFRQYRDALEAQNLSIVAVEGDGNCLFRAVSHQVYGDDRYYDLVRQHCMDYMESEKEYFEPYVVGDMRDFLRYLAHKRRDGVWGDDPEIQAMCEMYDRPAEVYAYDAAQGCRKLRTFHEGSSRDRHRPPICLSYYGGGHYDSIVSPLHRDNVIHEAPGEWERRHLEYSRRINTRASSDVNPDTRQAQVDTDREATEMAQLEHILMDSRNEFDAMNASLDDTLKRALAASETSAASEEQAALQTVAHESDIAASQAQLLENARKASEDEQLHKAIAASLNGTAPSEDFDAQVSAAIHASLADPVAQLHQFVPVRHGADAIQAEAEAEDDEMRRILELSVREYQESTQTQQSDIFMGNEDPEELAELQRAIQASLESS